MRQWSLTPDSPLCLTLAADARLSDTDYLDDQIWRIALGGGLPEAIAVETTYGLRARRMRIFPAYEWGQQIVSDPGQFAAGPLVKSLFPNYALLEFSPFSDLAVALELWVAHSHALASRIGLRNTGRTSKAFRFRLHAELSPEDESGGMGEALHAGVKVLEGRSAGLTPVVFLAGGASLEPSHIPALMVEASLEPGEANSLFWAHSARSTPEQSFAVVRGLAQRSWDAEIARIERVNDGWVEVHTGQVEWDAAFHMAQKVSLGAYLGPTSHLGHASFVETRTPERGFSQSEDGRDYDRLWSGQGAPEAFVNLMQILPAAPELAKGVVRNYLDVQSADGSIDGKPGLAGQRQGTLCIPLLASLGLRIYEACEDIAFVREVFPKLSEFIDVWISPKHDQDQDGLPEWRHTLQTGFPESPTFSPWQAWGQALDIRLAETPDLAAYLFAECQAMASMASLLGEPERAAEFEARAEAISRALEESWSEDQACYLHRDRDLHTSPPGRLLAQGRGAFEAEIGEKFDPPVRLVVRCHGPEAEAGDLRLTLRGRGERGRFIGERLSAMDFRWFWEFGSTTSQQTFTHLSSIRVEAVGEALQTQIAVADYSRRDLSQLLPLWAGMVPAARARRMIEVNLLDPKRYWRPFGLPACPGDDPAFEPETRLEAVGVHMWWNLMLGEALTRYGRREQAAELLGRLIKATAGSLSDERTFRQVYHPDAPQGAGARDSIAGVAPLSLFLQVVGVQLLSSSKVRIEGASLFPWPVRIRWRGLEVERQGDETRVVFANGQEARIKGEAPRLVEQVRA